MRAGSALQAKRLGIVGVLIISLVVTLMVRLAWMQTAVGNDYRSAAQANRVKEVTVPAPRGLIVDRRGQPLAATRSSLVVTVDRAVLSRQRDGGDAILRALAAELELSPELVRARLSNCGTAGAMPQPNCWNGPNARPVPIASDVPSGVGIGLMERQQSYPGVAAVMQPLRDYPGSFAAARPAASHLIGHVGRVTDEELERDPKLGQNDETGRAGLESQYDEVLSGAPGVQRVAVDRTGASTGVVEETAAIPGSTLVTNVDARLQGVLERGLSDSVELARRQGYAGDSAAGVVLDVTNGHVLALASYPSFDPNQWVQGISERDYRKLTAKGANEPLVDRVTSGLFPPASTFKVVTTAAATNAGFPLDGTYACPASVDVGGRTFRNYESEEFGSITLARALEVSCDTVFYSLAQKLWKREGGSASNGSPEWVVETAKGFGLGSATGIDLPAESTGSVADRSSKRRAWEQTKDAYCERARTGYPEEQPARAKLLKSYARDYCRDGGTYRVGDALNSAIGQGQIAVTPLQMASIYAAIANGGTLWQPQVVRAVLEPDGRVQRAIEPRQTGRLDADAQTIAYVQNALAGVTARGTGAQAFAGYPIKVAAKTGTGEVAGKDPVSWFASYAPADEPRYAVVVMVSQGGTGAGTSAPAVRSVYDAMFGIGGVDRVFGPDGPDDQIPEVQVVAPRSDAAQ